MAYRFFLGCSILFGVVMTLGTIGDVRSGLTINWRDIYPMFSLGFGLPLAIALWIRHQCR
ncbi:MAG TPA: hypothetical protein VHV83_16670 [Armatimonadota bacterium]|nr:hypothetical protein [Armatimonadota bacterium]